MLENRPTYLGGGLGEIAADSTPAYDVPFWPFDAAWDCGDWMAWHKELKKVHGQQKANELFLEAWNKQGFWEWNTSFCKYSGAFFDYFKAQGLDAGNFVSKIARNVTDTAVNVTGAAARLDPAAINRLLVLAGLGVGAYFLAPFMPVLKDKVKDWANR
jgi:hypothetical protein